MSNSQNQTCRQKEYKTVHVYGQLSFDKGAKIIQWESPLGLGFFLWKVLFLVIQYLYLLYIIQNLSFS